VPWLLNACWVAGAVYATIPLFWLFVHPFARRWRQRRGKVMPLIGLVWLACILLFLGLSWPWHSLRLYQNTLAWAPALALLFAGLMIYRRVSKAFSRDTIIGRHELKPEEHQQQVVTSGMHGKVRHPIYLGHTFTLSFLVVGSGLAVLWIFWAVAAVTGWMMIAAEERELAERLGWAYKQYQRTVPAFIPLKWFLSMLGSYQLALYTAMEFFPRQRLALFDPRVGLGVLWNQLHGRNDFPTPLSWGSAALLLGVAALLWRTGHGRSLYLMLESVFLTANLLAITFMAMLSYTFRQQGQDLLYLVPVGCVTLVFSLLPFLATMFSYLKELGRLQRELSD
jgi:protein-S-isoprenylcysteine O-methyltransferase Ste14